MDGNHRGQGLVEIVGVVLRLGLNGGRHLPVARLRHSRIPYFKSIALWTTAIPPVVSPTAPCTKRSLHQAFLAPSLPCTKPSLHQACRSPPKRATLLAAVATSVFTLVPPFQSRRSSPAVPVPPVRGPLGRAQVWPLR